MKSILTNTLSNQTDKPEESQFNENSTNQRGVKLENIENNRLNYAIRVLILFTMGAVLAFVLNVNIGFNFD